MMPQGLVLQVINEQLRKSDIPIQVELDSLSVVIAMYLLSFPLQITCTYIRSNPAHASNSGANTAPVSSRDH